MRGRQMNSVIQQRCEWARYSRSRARSQWNIACMHRILAGLHKGFADASSAGEYQ